MLRPGFEPESSARKAEMIGRTTPPEHVKYIIQFILYLIYIRFVLIYKGILKVGPMGFEPMAARL